MVRLPWPLPALLVWVAAWSLCKLALMAGAPPWAALGLGTGTGVLASAWGTSTWRRLMVALGFPLSLLFAWGASLPAWAWLLPLSLCLLVYPLNAWRDAPLFPTPLNALGELPAYAPLPAQAVVLDGGCGLGAGLRALRRAYPQARLRGIEWSWPLRALCALRCPWAQVRQGDLWRADWSGCAMVYLFQRPESMPRAVAKASAEMVPGAFLVSLEFEATELVPRARLQAPDGRPIWLYRQPFVRATSL